jgi:hypothetical protein
MAGGGLGRSAHSRAVKDDRYSRGADGQRRPEPGHCGARSSNPGDSGRSCSELGVAQEASRVHGRTLRPIHPVKRSRGRDSRMTSPSGLQSWEIFPPSWPETVARVRVAPNPSSSGGVGMAGPPRSVHVRTKVGPCSAPTISTFPFGVESAPYFPEFVPNSCSRSARLDSAEPEIPRSGQAIVSRSPCAPESSMT